MFSRPQICQSAAAKLRAGNAASFHAVLGFDGFVDDITDVVDQRHSPAAYERIPTIAQFARRIAGAAHQSTNFELVIRQQKLGGNGPIMADALAFLGLRTAYIGNLGEPAVHPVFEKFVRRAEVISVAPPAHTHALEFHDGKLMLGDLGPLSEITWTRILEKVGRERLAGLIDQADLLGMVNWTMLPHMTGIWQGLLREIIPHLTPKPRRVFIDLADPQKRLPGDLLAALAMLQKINASLHVILGLNLSEACQVASAIGLPRSAADADLPGLAVRIQKKLGLATVVIHPRSGAAAANEESSAMFLGPFVRQPMISTGAGDHFNAGFAAALLLDLSLEESLAAGCAASGYYVRTAQSPTAAQLAEFLLDLPEPQPESA